MDLSELKGAPLNLDGEWVKIPDYNGLELRVRGANYAPFVDESAKVMRELGADLLDTDGKVKFSATRIAQGHAMAKHILLDWRGMTSGGKPLAFDAQISAQLLTDPDCIFRDKSLFAAVDYASGIVANRRAEEKAKTSKNSVKPSAGD